MKVVKFTDEELQTLNENLMGFKEELAIFISKRDSLRASACRIIINRIETMLERGWHS